MNPSSLHVSPSLLLSRNVLPPKSLSSVPRTRAAFTTATKSLSASSSPYRHQSLITFNATTPPSHIISRQPSKSFHSSTIFNFSKTPSNMGGGVHNLGRYVAFPLSDSLTLRRRTICETPPCSFANKILTNHTAKPTSTKLSMMPAPTSLFSTVSPHGAALAR